MKRSRMFHRIDCSPGAACLRLVPWLFAAAVLAPAASAAPPLSEIATSEQFYQMALEARSERNYGAMLTLLRQAATRGELEAQEMLASVLLAGPALYGAGVKADPCEATHWARLAAEQGSETGRHQWMILNGLRDVPRIRKGCGPAPG
ncbi:hypothetical protein PIGHUM_01846 [Pigmentiphaga humi]|uniref:Sel1 repeat protein n=1 Tax=Pigmentiphaga humi TaxID=2478468 RepID=A0A3P4B1N1_9BURK|nr:sel1 repeat family protein [Pigmentiphaga humi]VCU69781.1 hypothetical protein PIGHUM_01846 [Pigmentiphaga humi]